eukprot:scaffold2224_cov261-Pinguiococcus_pyrenoidosus.AAC.38
MAISQSRRQPKILVSQPHSLDPMGGLQNYSFTRTKQKADPILEASLAPHLNHRESIDSIGGSPTRITRTYSKTIAAIGDSGFRSTPYRFSSSCWLRVGSTLKKASRSSRQVSLCDGVPLLPKPTWRRKLGLS